MVVFVAVSVTGSFYRMRLLASGLTPIPGGLVFLKLIDNLFTLQYFMTFISSSFTVDSRSAIFFDEKKMLVSSAKIRNDSLLDDFGRSLINSKKAGGLGLSLEGLHK